MSTPASLSRRRNYSGPAFLSYGFRPFFLGGAAWAALAVLLWLPLYFGEFALPTAVRPHDWHVHEMLYGYVAAVIAGFLLTAIPNWTGRLPVNGTPLAALFALWLGGRLAVMLSAKIGPALAATIDVTFLVALAAVALREIVAGRNWRNLRVLAVIGLLIAGNVTFHLETAWRGYSEYGARIGLAAIIFLITLIGGRIVPSFTRNWLARRPPGRLPAPFGRFDGLCMAVGAVALAGWIAAAEHQVTGLLLVAAGLLHAARLARWAGERTTSDRLVLVLHVGYAFVPLGFLLAGSAVFWSAVPPGAAIHAWGAGAIATMTLAVMTRASLGHTGRPLAATPGTQLIYGLVVAAALLRIVAAFEPSLFLYHAAAFAWIAAFGGFVVSYGPLLIGMQPVWSRRS
ncbi:MAG TPA: NnrS family protein [Xanthobacteraceae bacterium]|nr:NnrS family protein [Xanthobacteraceae bacterium]